MLCYSFPHRQDTVLRDFVGFSFHIYMHMCIFSDGSSNSVPGLLMIAFDVALKGPK
jgi:hypothetical protein